MILIFLAFIGFGIYLLIKGDGPARIVGILLILVASAMGFLFWVALAVELPPPGASLVTEVHHV